MSRLLIGFFILITSGVASADPVDGENERWLDRKSEGWFYYKETTEPVEEPVEEKEETQPIPLQSSEPENTDKGPAPLSSAWIRENIQLYLDAALDNPSPENVTAFLYIQKYAMDKSFSFMDASEEATLGRQGLDEIDRRPTATFANRKLDEVATENNKSILEKISSMAGIFFFMDGSESSMAQAQVLEMLGRNYKFDTMKIAIGEVHPTLQKAGIKQDNGHAEKMGVSSLPAIVLIRSDGLFDVISQAPVSYPDLQKRILVGAKRLELITEADFNSTRPLSNITQTLVDIPGKKQSSDYSSVPIPANQIINAFTGGMNQ